MTSSLLHVCRSPVEWRNCSAWRRDGGGGRLLGVGRQVYYNTIFKSIHNKKIDTKYNVEKTSKISALLKTNLAYPITYSSLG